MTEPMPFDLDHELAGLKDFQRRTVDHVHDRLWDAANPARRFLVADEVGLGKTLVARGVVARTIETLWKTVDRIDVVYICSNSQIARQNMPKLRVGVDNAMAHADRLTMLATKIEGLKDRKLNFISFTPGTSFNVTRSGGQAPERVLLYWILRRVLGNEVKARRWIRFFEGASSTTSFERQVNAFDQREISDALVEHYSTAMAGAAGPQGGPLRDELFACVEEFNYKRAEWRPAWELSHRRYRLIGTLRQLLARTAVRALEPDLVILDEFQRFKDLMNGDDEGADLAHELFNAPGVRVLLLSATPYKMYTLPDEPEGDDHYRDFAETVKFLAGEERAARVLQDLSTMRSALYADDISAARDAKKRVEEELRRVMARTERLASTPDRDGMVAEREWAGVTLASADVLDYRRLARTAEVVKGFDPLEFWRSSPYVLELMDGYKLKQRLEAHAPDDARLIEAFSVEGTRLSWKEIESYRALDPGNAKMRGLVEDVIESGAWRLAWIPPSLPYYELGGAYADPGLRTFTKRLIFSAWNVVPKAVSTVLSYEAERRLMTSGGASSRRYSERARPLLNFTRSDGRLSGMPVLGILYPSVSLAELGDPLRIAAELQEVFPLSRERLVAAVQAKVEEALASLPAGPDTGVVDERWYWAAGMLLDRHRVDLEAAPVARFQYGFRFTDDDGDSRFYDHTAEADALNAADLGRRPDDLVQVLTGIAVAGPAVTALRALSRVAGGASALRDVEVRNAASNIAWAVRNLMNRREMLALVRLEDHSDEAYWRDVVRHCFDGGLQSLLDEYVHVLDGARGNADEPLTAKLTRIAEEIDAALSLRTSVNSFTEMSVSGGRLHRESGHRVRSHFAVRFGRGTTEDQAQIREGQVRTAYNSPFWPFVLCSTSVGQEGLDFHHYSHAVVHWNLPSNPVDLEQREGRVHRYKGHAVRKNVASVYGGHAKVREAEDPWARAFDLAAADRPESETEIFPYWVFPGEASIERYVPALPLSREKHQYRRLMRTVGAYRLVFGQPRQEDLLRYLGERASELEDLAIDLAP